MYLKNTQINYPLTISNFHHVLAIHCIGTYKNFFYQRFQKHLILMNWLFLCLPLVQRTRQKENLKRYEKLNERPCARLHPVTCPWHRPFHLCNQHVLVSICTQSAKIIFIHDMKDQIHWLQIQGHRIKCKSLNSNVPVGGNTLTSHPFHKFILNTTSNCASLKEFTPEYTNHLITSFNCIIKDIETNIR